MTSLSRCSSLLATSRIRALSAINRRRTAGKRRLMVPLVKWLLSALAATTLTIPTVMAQQAADPAAEAAIKAWSAPEPWRTDRFYLQTSAATWHFNSDDEHDNSQALVNAEWRLDKNWLKGQVLLGAASFDNSYGQATWYAYGGLLWRPVDTVQPLYLKLTAGVIHGYRGEYQDKIPMNNSGYAPGIIPSVGYCYNRFCTELVVFGGAGMMLTVGATLP
jgi:hypothetical protein